MDLAWLDLYGLLCVLAEMLLDDLGSHRDDVLTLPVLDEIQALQRTHDVFSLDGGHLRDVFDREITSVFAKNLEKNLRPV